MKRIVSIILVCLTLLSIAVPASAAEQRASTHRFVDVNEGAYYYDAVQWAARTGITAGTDSTHFSPNQLCTRAEVVTFIWRSFGSQKPKTLISPFKDVKRGTFYYDAVLWCVENHITSGTSADYFSPTEYCTRGQVATFLFRMTAYRNDWDYYKILTMKPFLEGWVRQNPRVKFEDVSFSDYYGYSVYAMEFWGIVAGTNVCPHLFKPNRVCSRAEAVMMLYRYWHHDWSSDGM